jgi:hypothetical protein
MILTSATLKLPAPHIRHAVDYVGALLLVAGVTCFLLFSLWGGTEYAWSNPTIWAYFAAGVLLTILFILQERRAKEPILPLHLFKDPVITTAVLASMAIGACMLGGTVFLPVFLQAVRGVSATDSGLLMLPMMMGVVVSSIGTGRIISHTGSYRIWPIVGAGIVTLGFALFYFVTPTSPQLLTGVLMALLGLGIGAAMQPLVLAVQNVARRRDLGAATSLVNFSRSIGGTFAVAAFGAIFNHVLARELAKHLPAGTNVSQGKLLGSPKMIHGLPPGVRGPILDALAAALHAVFLAAVPIALVGFLICMFLRDVKLRDTLHDVEAKPTRVLAGSAPGLAPQAAHGLVVRATTIGDELVPPGH